MRTARAAAHLVLLPLAALSACGAPAQPTAPRAEPPHTSVSASTVPSTADVSPSDASPSPSSSSSPPLGDPPPDATSPIPARALAQAMDRAPASLRAFFRTDLAQDQWWAGVSGYFTPEARTIYSSTDVANVASVQVLDSATTLVPSSTADHAQISVATSAGPYIVQLVRADPDWLVERFIPPAPGS